MNHTMPPSPNTEHHAPPPACQCHSTQSIPFLDTSCSIKNGLREKTSHFTGKDPRERLCDFLTKTNELIPEFNINKITKSQLRQILKKRKGNRSCEIDFIDGYSIKLAAPLIEDILLHLVNLSIQTSSFGTLWKTNKVSPHFKKGDKTSGDNWRPVTDIVFVSKLVEAAVYEQVETHFTSNHLWHPNHHGFKLHTPQPQL